MGGGGGGSRAIECTTTAADGAAAGRARQRVYARMRHARVIGAKHAAAGGAVQRPLPNRDSRVALQPQGWGMRVLTPARDGLGLQAETHHQGSKPALVECGLDDGGGRCGWCRLQQGGTAQLWRALVGGVNTREGIRRERGGDVGRCWLAVSVVVGLQAPGRGGCLLKASGCNAHAARQGSPRRGGCGSAAEAVDGAAQAEGLPRRVHAQAQSAWVAKYPLEAPVRSQLREKRIQTQNKELGGEMEVGGQITGGSGREAQIANTDVGMAPAVASCSACLRPESEFAPRRPSSACHP